MSIKSPSNFTIERMPTTVNWVFFYDFKTFKLMKSAATWCRN